MFKVGDDVKVVKASLQHMQEYVGKTFIITKEHIDYLPGRTGYSTDENSVGKDASIAQYVFFPEELELVSSDSAIGGQNAKNESENNGGSTDYYKLPAGATELNDLIEAKNMPFWRGNIFKAAYRLGEKDVATEEYDLNKIIYFANRRLAMIRKEKENG